jgi:hypothetical protein
MSVFKWMTINLNICRKYIHQVLLNRILFWVREIIYGILDVNYEQLFIIRVCLLFIIRVCLVLGYLFYKPV